MTDTTQNATLLGMHKTKTWSATRLSCANRCMREFKYKYVDKRITNAYQPLLGIGSYVHSMLEDWYKAQKDGVTVDPNKYLTSRSEEDYNLELPDSLLARGMAVGYIRNYSDKLPYKVICVEKEQFVQIAGERYIVKLDGIVSANGKVYALEHKTTGARLDSGGNYWDKVNLDLQKDLYLIALRKLGYEPAGIIWDVLVRPKLKYQPSRETETDYMERVAQWMQRDGKLMQVTYDYDQIALDRTEEDLLQQVKLVRYSETNGLYPRNTKACYTFNRPCEYLPACEGRTTIGDNLLYKDKERRK